MAPRFAGLAAGAAVIAGLSGCSSQLTGKSIEKLIVQNVGSRGYPGITAKCPDVDDKVGKKFTCTITGSPKLHKVLGSVAKGDKVNIDDLQ